MIKITMGSLFPCPKATQDLKLNTDNRNATIEEYHYGPLNPNEPNEEFWQKIADKWDGTPEEAKKSLCGNCVAFDTSPRMKKCMTVVDEQIKGPGEFGYCWMHHFKCHSRRTCTTWAAGGPITDNETSFKWHKKNRDA